MGMMGKYKVIFDTTDPATSDNIGAYLRASDGTLLTHTDVGGKKSLDVNVANTISVTNAANFAEDSVAANGDIGTHILSVRSATAASTAGAAGDYASLITDDNGRLYTQIHDGGNSITVDGTVAVTQSTSPWVVGDGGGSLTVDAVDLDIRDLTHVSDSVKVGDGTDFLAVNADGSINAVVTATNLDIRDLTHVSDSVRVGDGTDFWAIDTTGLGRVADYYTAAANSAVSIPTTAGGTAIVASALSNRTEMFIQNNGNRDVYVGVGTVTTANGLKLVPGSVLEARVGAALSLKAIADSGTQDVRVLEFA